MPSDLVEFVVDRTVTGRVSMFIVFLAAVASASGPSFVGGPGVNDYPSDALMAGHQGVAYYKVDIGVDGKPYRCVIEHSTGFVPLDRATCKGMLRRAIFSIATDKSGKPIVATYRGKFIWKVPDMPPPTEWPGAELAFTVKSLPQGIASPLSLELRFIVDAGGKMESCTVAPNGDEAFDSAVCGLALRNNDLTVTLDNSGRPIRSLQTVPITFSVDTAGH